jgi:Domain of unknown function (DUF222)/HNH endonuclease
MDSNTHSTDPPGPAPAGHLDDLAALTVVLDRLAARDLDGLSDAVRAERVLELRRLLDRLEGQWLKELAGVDARGAAGAEAGQEVGSTAAWLRNRLRLAAGTASSAVRTARAVFRGPLTGTAQALTDGELSIAHAQVLAAGTQALPDHVTAEAEPVLVAAARRLDPTRLRRLLGHLLQLADPDGAERDRERRHARRGVWLAPTFEGMVAVDGLLEPEAGQTLLAALEPLARPADAHDARSGSQRNADALAELARRHLEGGRLPHTGGVRPQLQVTVDLDSLLGRPGAVGGEVGWAGPLDPEACRRLACDGALTRVLVTRQPANRHPTTHQPTTHPSATQQPATDHSTGEHPHPTHHPSGPPLPQVHHHSCQHQPAPHDQDQQAGIAARLQAAMTLLPPTLGGAPTQPLEVGRTTRVIQPAQRSALAVRDGGCVFPDCTRPLAWCEAHHLRHWLHGGPTDLANLTLLCRAHHRAVHEGGWRLQRGPDGRLTATPPHRRHPTARRHPPAA